MISSVDELIQHLRGTKYNEWDGQPWKEDGHAPFYVSDRGVNALDAQHVKEDGCCCAGFINLVCRVLSAPIPQCPDGDYSGGMAEWTTQKAWRPLKPEETDIGAYALLMVPYGTPWEQQGHIGIYLGEDRVAHCISGKGLHIDTLRGYPWQYYCPVTDWLT